MDELLLKVLELVIIILITVVIRYGIPFIKQKMDTDKLEVVEAWVQDAVNAAEQTIIQSGSGAEKKAVVTEFLKKILTAKNIIITDDQLNTLIEAAVFAMKQSKVE